MEKILGHQIIKMNKILNLTNEELSKTNGLCDSVWRRVAEYLVISVYYCFRVSGMTKINAGAEFYDSSNKLLSIIPWGLPNTHIIALFVYNLKQIQILTLCISSQKTHLAVCKQLTDIFWGFSIKEPFSYSCSGW